MSASSGWRLNERDRWLLDDLRRALYALLPLARSGDAVIGVGEVIDAIESVLEGGEVDIIVGLEIGFRRRDEDAEEGLFVCLRLDEDELVLDELRTSYHRSVGSDHFTIDHAVLRPGRHLDEDGVAAWIRQLEEVRSFDDTEMTVSRDHV